MTNARLPGYVHDGICYPLLTSTFFEFPSDEKEEIKLSIDLPRTPADIPHFCQKLNALHEAIKIHEDTSCTLNKELFLQSNTNLSQHEKIAYLEYIQPIEDIKAWMKKNNVADNDYYLDIFLEKFLGYT